MNSNVKKRGVKNIDRTVDDILLDVGIKKPIQTRLEIDNWTPIDEWIEKYFYLYDTAELVSLEPPQRYALREAVKTDENGRFVYDTVLWSWIKKSAKTTIIAAVVDYFCSNKPRSRWRLVANDLKQADSRVGMYLRENILIGQNKGFPHDENNDFWQFRKDIEITDRNLKIIYPNGSIVEMIPVDPQGEAGGNDDGIVFSELWGWKSDKHQLMFAEMTIAPTRYGFAQRWIDTYAGFTGEAPVLEPLYRSVVNKDNKLDIEANPFCYANDTIFATWVEQPLLSWQTKEYYASEKRTLSEMQFLRLHRNQWGTSEDSFLDSEAWWHNCKLPLEDIPPLGRYDEIVIGLDAAVTNDCFGMVAISRAPLEWIIAKGYKATDDIFIIRYARQWTPPKRGKIEFYGEYQPEGEIDRLIENYNVVQVCYDPYQLESFVSQQISKGGAWYETFNQGGERAKSDKFLYDTIRERRLVHSGNADLTSHVLNANKKITSDRLIRLVKRAEHLKIDLAVATSMAMYRALEVIPK